MYIKSWYVGVRLCAPASPCSLPQFLGFTSQARMLLFLGFVSARGQAVGGAQLWESLHVPFLPSFSLCSRLRKGLCILVQRTSPCVLMLLLSFWACSRPEPRFGIRLSVVHVKACDLSGWTGWRDMSDCPVPGGSGWGAVGRALCLPEKSSFFAALKPAGS